MPETAVLDDVLRDRLLAAARAVPRPRRLSPTVEAGGIRAALLSASGATWVGVCIDAASGVGFCAEHAAATMVTAGEQRVLVMVAVSRDGSVLQPCGRCRELVVQLDPGNAATQAIPPRGTRPLRASLPDHWLLDRPTAAP